MRVVSPPSRYVPLNNLLSNVNCRNSYFYGHNPAFCKHSWRVRPESRLTWGAARRSLSRTLPCPIEKRLKSSGVSISKNLWYSQYPIGDWQTLYTYLSPLVCTFPYLLRTYDKRNAIRREVMPSVTIRPFVLLVKGVSCLGDDDFLHLVFVFHRKIML